MPVYGYELFQRIEDLKQEIAELSAEIMALDPDHEDIQHLTDLLWKSENELDQLMDIDQF